ncbi:GNAT family N-acetyltransferase [Janibacter alittae]|uniref:GNAT family N-acetyltransferase n=1 Tax=Janibacter alittae TaxID=3115209 RepID=A0ABZ2MKT9_9MICO
MWLQRQLADDDELSGFDCGVHDLDAWLYRHAHRMHRQGIVRVYVWVNEATPDDVVAYAAIQPTQVVARDLTRGTAGGHSLVPGYLIARLALHRDLQGQGEGAQLLLSALEVCLAAADVGGGRIIVVDPIDETARAFYETFGFTPTKGPGDRLVMKMSTAAAALRDDVSPA